MAIRINKDVLTAEQKEIIRKQLYMQPKISGFFAKKRFAVSKDPILMWSLDKPKNEVIVPYIFGNTLLGYHVNSKKQYPPGKFNFNGTLRQHQIPITTQALEHLNSLGTTTLGVYPGCGKTIMSAYLSSKLEGLVLVVFPVKVVEPSWFNTFKEFTDASVWLNNGTNPIPKSCNVILTMDTQFHKIPQEILKMVRILVIDEAHLFCVPSRVHCLLGTTPQYIISCTATPDRTDGMESILHSVCGTHGIYLKSPSKFDVYRLDTGIKVPLEKNKNGDTDWSKLVKSLCDNEERNNLIFDLVKRNYEKHKIMVLTWNKSHAYYIKDTLVKLGIPSDILAGNKNTYKDSRVLVATSQKIFCGFDEAMACPDWGGQRSNMMILTGSTKSLAGLEQMTGRVFRSEFPTIIDLVDDMAIIKRHWTERSKWYNDSGRNGEIHHMKINKLNTDETQDNTLNKINPSSLARARLKINNKLTST